MFAQMGKQVWKIQSSILPKSPCDQSKERTCSTPKGSTDAVPTGAWIWSKHPLCDCSVASFRREAYQFTPSTASPVNFFAPAGAVKFWVKASTPAFRFFLYYTLDKVVCPCLANLFGMRIFHPTTEEEVKALLYATVDVWVFCWCEGVTKLIFLWLAAVMRHIPCNACWRNTIFTTRSSCILWSQNVHFLAHGL